MQRNFALSFGLFSLLSAPVEAQELIAGKPAPALQVARWLKGRPVPALEQDHVYVIEFWATWCGPCIDGIPHLSEVQKAHGDAVTVIGVTTEDEYNTLAAAEQLVKDQGDAMAYTVAWDDGHKTFASWFEAAGQDGIPTCFVVDKAGTIAWIGHPQWLDAVLPDVVKGGFTVQGLADKIDGIEKRMTRIFLAAAVEPEKALMESAELLQVHPFLTEQVEMGMFQLLIEGEGIEHAWAYGERIVARAIRRHDAMTLNTIAWAIVDPEAQLAKRNLDLALKAADKAVEFTASKDGSVLDTLARCHAWRGDYARALDLQKLAIAAVGDDEEAAAALGEALHEYELKVAEVSPKGGK